MRPLRRPEPARRVEGPLRRDSSTRPSLARNDSAGSDLRDIYRRLYRAYGPQHWWPGDTPLEIAVGAILTQNTAWSNVEKAIAVLKSRRLLTLKRLARLSPAGLSNRGASQLAPLIRSAGFYNVKAARLSAFIGWLKSAGGFAGLKQRSTPELRAHLLACHGVGPETADSILLYALGRPVFVIDAYTRRILSRYGLIAGDEPYEHLRLMFESSLPHDSKLYNEYHALLVRLAKENCRSKPACDSCPLA